MKTLKYPLVCFDLDGTLVDDTIYIWKTLHETFNTDKVARQTAYDDYFSAKITYQQWFENDLELLKNAGATKLKMLEIFDSLKVMKGAKELLQKLKNNGHKVAIISGSLDIVVDHLFGDFQFDYILINHIMFNEQGLISGGIPTKFDLKGKADGIKELCKREGISVSQAAFIGDNENDVWIAETAGLSIAFNCKSDKLAKICSVEIKEKNLLLVDQYLS